MSDRSTWKTAHEVAVTAVRAAFATHPVLKDYNVTQGGGKITSISADLVLAISAKNLAKAAIANVGFIPILSDEAVRAGLAGAGTPILYGFGKKGTVIRARQKKYLFRDETDINGKEYVINFTSCKFDKERAERLNAEVEV